MKNDERIEATVTITNTGKRKGDEIVQVYLRDRVGSVVRPVKELKDFAKISLNAGESTTVRFVIDKEKLSFYDQKLNWVTEPGMFDIMVGASSADIRLKDEFELVK